MMHQITGAYFTNLVHLLWTNLMQMSQASTNLDFDSISHYISIYNNITIYNSYALKGNTWGQNYSIILCTLSPCVPQAQAASVFATFPRGVGDLL